jgi:serine phosphatase RsbU (regulator of sigma subunit)
MKLNIIRQVTSKGILPNMTALEEKSIIITNYILILAAIVSFGRIFLFYINDDIYFSLISVCACVFFIFAYFMNTKHYHNFAKYTTIIAGNGAILIKELVSGGTSNQLYLMIASFGIVLILFNIEDKIKIFIAFLIPATSITLSIFFADMISEPIIMSPKLVMLDKFFGAISAVVIIVLVIWYFVKQSRESELKLLKSNNLLQKYNEEINEQKSMIEIHLLELEQINYDLMVQKRTIEYQHSELTASITYASTIQHAILPWENTLRNSLGDYLIFYKPKDIVSGDFYWLQEVDGIKFLAVIDCTGHGIPGAMLTVIASTVLDDAVLGRKLKNTNEILTFMNEKVTEILNQNLIENKIRDGMEVVLVAIHQDKIQFSGAGRPLFIKNGKIEIIKTDKRGIAGQTENDNYKFSAVDIIKSENITLYLTTDGFADQMNEQGKKYSSKRFMELLEQISDKSFTEQTKILEKEFLSHSGNREQIDDITIFGVKL